MPSVEITDVEAIRLRLPTVNETADGTQDVLIVKVVASDGTCGFGEASTCSFVAKAIVDAPRSAARRHGLREILIGRDATDIEGAWSAMYEHTFRYGRRGVVMSAIGAIDLALWDIAGKLQDLPVSRLLSAHPRSHVEAYGSFLFGDTPAESGDRAAAAADLGLQALKAGWGTFGCDEESDVAHLRALTDAVPAGIELMVDAGGVWDWETALGRARRFSDFDIAWLEEPVNADDAAGYGRLCAQSPVPIAGGELETSVGDFSRLIDVGGLHVLQPDLAICGGLTVGRRIEAVVERAGRRLVPHVYSTGLCLLASLHWLASRRVEERLELSLSHSPFMRDLVTSVPQLENGALSVPAAPGLGIELDWDLVERYRVSDE